MDFPFGRWYSLLLAMALLWQIWSRMAMRCTDIFKSLTAVKLVATLRGVLNGFISKPECACLWLFLWPSNVSVVRTSFGMARNDRIQRGTPIFVDTVAAISVASNTHTCL